MLPVVLKGVGVRGGTGLFGTGIGGGVGNRRRAWDLTRKFEGSSLLGLARRGGLRRGASLAKTVIGLEGDLARRCFLELALARL